MSATDTAEMADDTAADASDETTEDEPYDKPAAMALINKLRPYQLEAERLRKEIEKRDRAEKAARDAKALEDGRLAELAEERAARIAELEPQLESLTTERDRALKVIQTQVRELSKDLPDWVRDAIEGKDSVDQFAFLAKHREAIVGGGRQGPRTTPNGRPVGAETREERIQQEIDAQRGGLRLR